MCSYRPIVTGTKIALRYSSTYLSNSKASFSRFFALRLNKQISDHVKMIADPFPF